MYLKLFVLYYYMYYRYREIDRQTERQKGLLFNFYRYREIDRHIEGSALLLLQVLR